MGHGYTDTSIRIDFGASPDLVPNVFPDHSRPSEEPSIAIPSRQQYVFPPSRAIPIPRDTNDGNAFLCRPLRRPSVFLPLRRAKRPHTVPRRALTRGQDFSWVYQENPQIS